jgi:hypothetical protein
LVVIVEQARNVVSSDIMMQILKRQRAFSAADGETASPAATIITSS